MEYVSTQIEKETRDTLKQYALENGFTMRSIISVIIHDFLSSDISKEMLVDSHKNGLEYAQERYIKKTMKLIRYDEMAKRITQSPDPKVLRKTLKSNEKV